MHEAAELSEIYDFVHPLLEAKLFLTAHLCTYEKKGLLGKLFPANVTSMDASRNLMTPVRKMLLFIKNHLHPA